jgi:hypothetical protein
MNNKRKMKKKKKEMQVHIKEEAHSLSWIFYCPEAM